jgi:hypothetical protein
MRIEEAVAKRCAGRRFPLHPDLREVLTKLQRESAGKGPIVSPIVAQRCDETEQHRNGFVTVFGELGIDGCSSHSGVQHVHYPGGAQRAPRRLRFERRAAARGHRPIETQQRYIDGHTEDNARWIGRR